MARRRYLQCKKVGFKKGYNNPEKGKSYSYKPDSTPQKYVRVDTDVFEARIDEHENALTFRDIDGSVTPNKPLRPKTKPSSLVTEYTAPGSSDSHPDLWLMKCFAPALVQVMFNTEIRKHCIEGGCSGDMNFDPESSRSWGSAWSECLKCTKCGYKSKSYKLYEEVENEKSKRGRKAAKVNRGLAAGCMTTQIGYAGYARICSQANILPMSESSFNNNIKVASDTVSELNNEQMKQIRQKLKDDNRKIGFADSSKVRTEGDACYNNKLFMSEETPSQAGTIAIYTMCENNSKDKKIIGCRMLVKVCATASKLRNEGKEVTCPNHDGPCTANIQASDSIGNEEQWSQMVAHDVEDDLNIFCYTGDGDSKNHQGVSKASGRTVIHLKDPRHMANSLKKSVYKIPFTKTMFSGVPYKLKSNIKNRFSLNIRQRCKAELKKAHRVHDGNMASIKKIMPKVIDAIILCYKGYCGDYCSKYSLICNGQGQQAKYHMPSNVKIKMAESDEKSLRKCLGGFLGPVGVLSMRFLTSTQKCEAVNRAYQACMPKNTLFPRSGHGRIGGCILKLNVGEANATLLKSRALGNIIHPGSSVVKHLLKVDKITARRKSKVSRARARWVRMMRRRRNYQTHADVHYKKGLTDPFPSF